MYLFMFGAVSKVWWLLVVGVVEMCLVFAVVAWCARKDWSSV